MKLKKYIEFSVVLILSLVLSVGCSTKSASETSNDNTNIKVTETTSNNEYFSSEYIDVDNLFSERDYNNDYNQNECETITLSDNASTSSSSNVTISENTITINKEGSYILTGSLSNGQIIVSTSETEKVQLILDNVNINSNSSAPIYIKQADKVFITSSQDSENVLTTSGEYVAIDDNNIDSVIFSKDDLTLNGKGTIKIESQYGHGIVSKDDLVITSGTYNITSKNHGISGKDSVSISNGDFTINSSKDAIHSENSDDATKGYIYISDGNFNINSGIDGFDASIALQIDGGNYTKTGGGSANASIDSIGNEMAEWGKQNDSSQNLITEESTSSKALKSDGNIYINNGTFEIDSFDDSIHSNSDVCIANDSFNILSGDDGIHADSNVCINSGTIKISKSYEGIEGQSIDINGGNISILSYDDGLNAAGGNDGSGIGERPGKDNFAVNEDCYINIAGGIININASGDGIDSNGNLTISDGEIYINGPTNGGNGSLDYNGTGTITGGIFVSAGTKPMEINFSDTSTQGCILATASNKQTGTITLKDDSNNVIVSFQPENEFDTVVISSPDINVNKTYSLSMGMKHRLLK